MENENQSIVESSSSSSHDEFLEEQDENGDEERDEFAEVQKLAQRETRRVRLWKAILL
eukprot:CAMPEP_0172457466 /NCGR_PEP_ID=MMETSP1065-20121228/22495_1 /TAXON_ID=265537 /ORGANISM="Amphiprora paludosa, Strain CCMP125" /LENGTH=57 /DNA_ID=CAMNT_0013211233 /DNA_START=15 /DNA_END=185 /DNA_ORIENTATION=+